MCLCALFKRDDQRLTEREDLDWGDVEGTAGHKILEWEGRGHKAKDPENQAWEFKPNGMEQSDRVDITKINLVAEDVVDSRQGEQLG